MRSQGGHPKVGSKQDEQDEVGDVPSTHAFAAEGPERLRMAARLRSLIAASLEVDPHAEELPELLDDLDALGARFDALATGRGVPLFGESKDGDLNPVLPFSPMMGRANPVAPPIELDFDGKRAIGIVTLGVAHQGADGLVHGGIIASLYDEVLAAANMASGVAGPTAKLSVRYRRPTPLGEPLRFEAWVDKRVGRRIHTLGRCFFGETRVTDAEGVFVQITAGSDASRDWASQR
jgi:acyl-coenzyme A thioesterase PaaI-like protein